MNMDKRKESAAVKMSNRVLSTLVSDNTVLNLKNFNIVKDYLKKTDFITPTAQKVADVVWFLHSEGRPVHLEAVFWELIERGEPAQIGHFLSGLIETMKDAAQTIDADILSLRNISMAARLEEATKRATKKLNEGADPYQVQSELAAETDLIISEAGPKEKTPDFKDIDALEDLRKINDGEGPAGIPTGWGNFDYFTSGFQKTQFIVVAARPGMGKTSFMLSAIVDAILTGKKILFVSLEMPKIKVKQQLMQIISNTPKSLFLRGEAQTEHFNKMKEAQRLLNASNLKVIDDVFNISDIRAKIDEEAAGGLDLVVLDYLQLCKDTSKRYPNREQEVSEISRQLKIITNRYNLPLIAACQVGRPMKGVGIPAPPSLSDLRESGAIEQDANIVYSIHRNAYYIKGNEYNQLTDDEKQEAFIFCLKYRGGETNTYQFRWLGKITKFQEWETPIPDLRDDLPYNSDDRGEGPDEIPPPEDENDIPF